jgi:hypothetical protein
MTYGINVQNQNGVTLIDDNFSSYVIKEEGTLSNGAAIPTLTGDELIFYSPTSNGNSVSVPHLDGSYFIISGTLKYVIIRPVSSQPLSGDRYGVRVYGSFGQNIFDSGARFMNPIGMYSHNVYGTTTFTLPAPRFGRRMWFSSNVFKFIENYHSGASYDMGEAYSTMLVKNSDTSYTVTGGPLYTGPPATFATSMTTYQFLVMEA